MFEVGREHDGWFVDTQLGAGGMGAVYRCHKVGLPELVVAIKVVLHKDADALARFRREAALLDKLSHPGVVRFRDVQCQREPWYIVMDLVEGCSLKEWAAEPRSTVQRLDIARQLAEAVRYVHSQGLRHRDIKPTNVIVDKSDRLVLVDFGIAVRPEDPRLTTYGRCGSPLYAPPEWRAQGVDEEAWDVYSVGQVLHELFTGQEAFSGGSIDDVMFLKRSTPCLDLGEGSPEPLRALVRAATALDPKERPSAVHLADTLARLDLTDRPLPPPVSDPAPEPRTDPVQTPHPPPPPPPPDTPAAQTRPPRPKPTIGVVLLAILVAIGACFGLS